MKNPFTEHPLSKGQSYLEHLVTASTIGLRLLLSACAFIFHSIFPFIPIPQPLNLEAVAAFLLQENQAIEAQWQAAKPTPTREQTLSNLH